MRTQSRWCSVKTTHNANGQVTAVQTGTSNADGSGFVELMRSGSSGTQHQFRDTIPD